MTVKGLQSCGTHIVLSPKQNNTVRSGLSLSSPPVKPTNVSGLDLLADRYGSNGGTTGPWGLIIGIKHHSWAPPTSTVIWKFKINYSRPKKHHVRAKSPFCINPLIFESLSTYHMPQEPSKQKVPIAGVTCGRIFDILAHIWAGSRIPVNSNYWLRLFENKMFKKRHSESADESTAVGLCDIEDCHQLVLRAPTPEFWPCLVCCVHPSTMSSPSKIANAKARDNTHVHLFVLLSHLSKYPSPCPPLTKVNDKQCGGLTTQDAAVNSSPEPLVRCPAPARLILWPIPPWDEGVSSPQLESIVCVLPFDERIGRPKNCQLARSLSTWCKILDRRVRCIGFIHCLLSMKHCFGQKGLIAISRQSKPLPATKIKKARIAAANA